MSSDAHRRAHRNVGFADSVPEAEESSAVSELDLHVRRAGRNGLVWCRADLRAIAGWSVGESSVQVLDAHRPGRGRAGQDRKLHRHAEPELRLSRRPDTVEKIYDNLDRSRALQAYLMAIPIVNQAGMRDSLAQFGPDNQTDVIWENLVDPRTVELTANDNTIYNFIWIDTQEGPARRRSSARGPGRRERLLVSLGRRCRHHRRGPRQRRQVSRAAARLQGRGSRGLRRRAPEHLRQLALLPRLRRRWLHQARRRVGEEAPQDLSALATPRIRPR